MCVNIATVSLTAGTVHGSLGRNSWMPPTQMKVVGRIAEADLQNQTTITAEILSKVIRQQNEKKKMCHNVLAGLKVHQG